MFLGRNFSTKENLTDMKRAGTLRLETAKWWIPSLNVPLFYPLSMFFKLVFCLQTVFRGSIPKCDPPTTASSSEIYSSQSGIVDKNGGL